LLCDIIVANGLPLSFADAPGTKKFVMRLLKVDADNEELQVNSICRTQILPVSSAATALCHYSFPLLFFTAEEALEGRKPTCCLQRAQATC